MNTPTSNQIAIIFAESDDIIKALVDALRLVSNNPDIKEKNLIIPDDCQQYGFAEGNYNLSELLYFLADMIEE